MFNKFLFIAVAVLVLSGNGGARAEASSAVEARDVLGRTLRLARPAERIVSLNPAATEILFAVGAGSRVLGVTEFCDYPPEAASRTIVGGFSGATVSVEQIVALKPDLVLVSAEMHVRIIPLLDALGIPLFAVDPHSFQQVYETIDHLGRLTACPAGARNVIQDMRSRIAALGAPEKEPVAVFWEIWDDPLMTIGGTTFISEAIELAGGRNVFADLREQWPGVNLEQVLLRKPDWILSGDDHGDRLTPEALGRRAGWATVPAVRAGRIAVIEADIIYRSGPRLAEAVEALSRLLR